MKDIIEDDKDLFPDNLPEPEFNKKSVLFFGIITALALYLIFCFLLYIVPKTIYIFYSCATGLGIGTVISYGINKNSHINHKLLFIPVILSTLLAFFMFKAIDMTTSGFHSLYLHLGADLFYMLAHPVPIFFTVLLFSGTWSFFFYRQRNIKKKALFYLIVLYIFTIFSACSILLLILPDFIEPLDAKAWFYVMILFFIPGLIYIFYNCILAFGIRRTIYYRMKDSRYISKKNIILLIFLASFIAYLLFSISLYAVNITFEPGGGKPGVFDFLRYTGYFATYRPFTLYADHLCMCEEDRTENDRFIRKFLVSIYNNITFGKISEDNIIILINLQAWIVGFFITFFCAWKFIVFTCPWLAKDCLSGSDKRSSLFLMRMPAKLKIIFLLLILIFFVKIITLYIWENITKPATVSKITSACEAGDLATVNVLLMKYPKLIDITNKDGYNPLHCACLKGKKDIVKFLLDKGADINKSSVTGAYDSALDLAAGSGQKEVVELLISRGADINAKNNLGSTPIGSAAVNGDRDIVELLLDKGADIKEIGEERLLSYAIYSGSAETVELLISKGIDINMKKDDGTTLLHEAAGDGKKEVVEFLISKGADIKAMDKEDRSVLIYAVRSGSGETVELLLSKGLDINAKDCHGKTSLHEAVSIREKQMEIIKLLISKGADINAKDDCGKTPLHYAVCKCDYDLVELLISEGADINAKSKDGETPLVMAQTEGHKYMAELLSKKGAHK